MHIRICEKCEKTFNCLFEERSRSICYGCALDEFCGNFPPEEGDFNSARLTSGEMTEQEYQWLMEDLRSVELGVSIRERYLPEEQGNSIWNDCCRSCGMTLTYEEGDLCDECVAQESHEE